MLRVKGQDIVQQMIGLFFAPIAITMKFVNL
jgi:hypothetical protein